MTVRGVGGVQIRDPVRETVNRDHVWDTVRKQDSNYSDPGGEKCTDS